MYLPDIVEVTKFRFFCLYASPIKLTFYLFKTICLCRRYISFEEVISELKTLKTFVFSKNIV